jgi:hypothetical protein
MVMLWNFEASLLDSFMFLLQDIYHHQKVEQYF